MDGVHGTKDYTPTAKPFDSFTKAHKFLQIAGYVHLLNPRNKYTKTLHHIYRHFSLLGIAIYIIQHSIYIIQVRDDVGKSVEGLILTIPEMFLFIKVAALLFKTNRLKTLIDLMDDDIFAAHCEWDEKLIRAHTKLMHRIWQSMMFLLTCIATVWISGPVFKRMKNENEVVPSYMPFKQDTWFKFLLADFLDTVGVAIWVGYGHLSVDSIIATYYAQAHLQLQLISYNLKHLFDDQNEPRKYNGLKQGYIDVVDATVQKRFVFYVRRYERVVWYTNEVTSIFNLSISFQFLAATFGTCLGVYQMSSIDMFTAQFFFSLLYYVGNQAQMFVSCHFGGMIEYESKLLTDSVYQSEWTSLSPRFRKQLSIVMCRWVRPITPTIAGIVPLSHATFLTITRSAYTMYTVLKTRNRGPN